MGEGMGSYATVGRREQRAERSNESVIIPIRQEQKAGSNQRQGSSNSASPGTKNGERERSAASKRSVTADEYISALEKRKYLHGGVPRPDWVVFRRPTMNEAFDDAYDDAYRRSDMVSSWDWEVKEAKDAVRSAKMTPRLELMKRKAKEAVEKQFEDIPDLPKDTKSLAVSDAVTMVSLLELGSSKIKNWEKHYNTMLAADEVWKSGFARLDFVKGKQIVYGKRDEEDVENIIRL
jgi:hypothetical protein